MKQTYRHIVQTVVSLLQNGYIAGFLKGKIWNGHSKIVCVPGLNCYSCPGALGACPIGALQAVIGGYKHNFTFYVSGILIFIGSLFGRLVCGFLCPFGFIQDLLYKIPLPFIGKKKRKADLIKIPKKIDKVLRFIKYFILIIPVLLLPAVITNDFGMGDPFFCKYICPAGTLEGGLTLVLKNEQLRSVIGFLFNWKVSILAAVILSSILVYRPFCKYFCPLGAFYALFNKIGFYQMHVDKKTCIHCKACEKNCDMQVSVLQNINSSECIRCGKCQEICPVHAISSDWIFKQVKQPEKSSLQ